MYLLLQYFNLNNFMMKKITLLFVLLVVSFGYSQTLPIDFEESEDSNIFASVADGGVFDIITDTDATGEFVGQFSGKVGGALYDHINVPLATSLDIPLRAAKSEAINPNAIIPFMKSPLYPSTPPTSLLGVIN